MLRWLDTLRPYRVFDKPVFILAAPRSGSTFLFDLLCRFPETWAGHAEMDDVWWRHFPFARLPEPCDYVAADQYTSAVGRGVRRDFYRGALWAREERGARCGLRERVGGARVRYLDKTIANCFHIGFLAKAFPDACFIVLLRGAQATISSMMEGWGEPKRFVNREAQPYINAADSTITQWCYAAPPGWRAMPSRPLVEVSAWSWRQHVETAENDLRQVPQEQRLVVKYEELMADLTGVARRVAEFCHLEWCSEVSAFIDNKPLSRTTVSAPQPDKWRRLHGREIERILPSIAPMMARLGYDVRP
ncbi:MAG: sulfotransferase family protein [Gemmataceae bacterium]